MAAGVHSSSADTAAGARLRSGCEARKAFAAEIARPKPDDLAIAIAIAAEENPDEPLSACEKRVTDALDELAARATTRARLEHMLGDRSGAAVVARAVGAAMFGDQGLPEENNTSIEFFAGDVDDYYNPANSLIDEVIRRRRGIPITMSLSSRGRAPPLVHRSLCSIRRCTSSSPRTTLPRPLWWTPSAAATCSRTPRSQLTDVSPLEGLSLAARMLRNLRMIYEKGRTRPGF